jgi:hypothetical protein
MRNVRAQQKLERAWIKRQEEQQRKKLEKRKQNAAKTQTNPSGTGSAGTRTREEPHVGDFVSD